MFPELLPELYPHFIRGYFDGNGSISRRTSRPNQIALYWCSSDKRFLEGMRDELAKNQIETYILTEPRDKMGYKDMHTLRIGKAAELVKLYEYLYKDAGKFKMLRKSSIFEVYVNTVLIAKQATA